MQRAGLLSSFFGRFEVLRGASSSSVPRIRRQSCQRCLQCERRQLRRLASNATATLLQEEEVRAAETAEASSSLKLPARSTARLRETEDITREHVSPAGEAAVIMPQGEIGKTWKANEILEFVYSTPIDNPLPYSTLVSVICNAHLLDDQALLKVFHIISVSIPTFTPRQSGILIGRSLKLINGRHMTVLTSSLITMFTQRIDQALQNGEIVQSGQTSASVPEGTSSGGNVLSQSIQNLYYPLFTAYRKSWRHDGDIHALQYHRQQSLRLVKHMFKALDSLPSSSAKRPPIDIMILNHLASPQCLSDELRGLVSRRLRQAQQKLQSRRTEVFLNFGKPELDVRDMDEPHLYLHDPSSQMRPPYTANATTSYQDSQVQATSVMHHETDYWEEDDAVDSIKPSKEGSGGVVSSSFAPTASDGENAKPADQSDINSMLSKVSDQLQTPISIGDTIERQRSLEAHRRAWAVVTYHITALQGHAPSADQLRELRIAMPKSAVSASSVTPIMKGLINAHQPGRAWRMWLNHKRLSHQLLLEGVPMKVLIDPYIISTALRARGMLHGLDDAIVSVDIDGNRPSTVHRISAKKRRPDAATNGPIADAKERDSKDLKISMNTSNLNTLLSLCRTYKAPSTAFRLWTAAKFRWGVYQDSITLALLLDTARKVEMGGDNEIVDDIDTRIKQLAHEFSFRRILHPDKTNDEMESQMDSEAKLKMDDYINGPTSALLDPEGYKWYHEYGVFRPWQKARLIFRQVILGNYPHLRKVKSPLDLQSGSFAYLSAYFGRIRKPRKPSTEEVNLPDFGAKYLNIIPDDRAFHSYISLLGYFNVIEEIPVVLAWMRELGVKPNWNCMCAALTFIVEKQGPRRAVRGPSTSRTQPLSLDEGKSSTVEVGLRPGKDEIHWLRDDEILRAYLEEWIGDAYEVVQPQRSKGGRRSEFKPSKPPDGYGEDGRRKKVPTEEDVRAYRMWLAWRGKKLING